MVEQSARALGEQLFDVGSSFVHGGFSNRRATFMLTRQRCGLVHSSHSFDVAAYLELPRISQLPTNFDTNACLG
jgi:hypothetical protein